jgi:hypothetical protein
VGSHRYGKIKIGRNSSMTMGNTSSHVAVPNAYMSAESTGEGHRYEFITVGQGSRVHTGDTGDSGNMRAHDYGEIEVGDHSTIITGDFDSLATKEMVLGEKRHHSQRLERSGVTA